MRLRLATATTTLRPSLIFSCASLIPSLLHISHDIPTSIISHHPFTLSSPSTTLPTASSIHLKMGWLDGVSEVGSSTSHHRRSKSSSGSKHHHSSHSPRASSIFNLGAPSSSKSHHEEKPRASSVFGLGGESSRNDREREKPRGSSIFGTGDGRHNSSRSTFFGGMCKLPRPTPPSQYQLASIEN